MVNKKKYVATGLMMLCVALLAAACGGGGGSGTASSAGGGETLTFTGYSFSSIPGLSFNQGMSSSSPAGTTTLYTENFANLTSLTNIGFATLSYWKNTTTYDSLAFNATPNDTVIPAAWYFAGPPTNVSLAWPTCWVSGASAPALPDCKTWGIAASRVAGTITFSNTPVFASGTSATGTMSGTLTYTPF